MLLPFLFTAYASEHVETYLKSRLLGPAAPFHHLSGCGTLSDFLEELGISCLKPHMKAGEARLMNKAELIEGLLGKGPGTGVARDAFNRGKTSVEMLEDLHQGLGIHDEAIGVSQEDRGDMRSI
jgi:hypothetical protein